MYLRRSRKIPPGGRAVYWKEIDGWYQEIPIRRTAAYAGMTVLLD